MTIPDSPALTHAAFRLRAFARADARGAVDVRHPEADSLHRLFPLSLRPLIAMQRAAEAAATREWW